MKKFIAFSSATLLTAAAMTAIDWGQVTNLATGSTVTVSSNSNAAATITDNNNGTSWQATGGANSVAPDWALIDLGEEKTFNEIEIIWEASHPTLYSVYASTEKITYAADANDNTRNVIDEVWLAEATPIATGGDPSESGFTDNLSLDEGITARYILIYGNEYNGFASQYGSRIFEVRVANIEGRDEVSSLSVTPATVITGQTAEVTVTPVNVTGNALDFSAIENLTLTCSTPDAVEITPKEDGKFDVKGITFGNYTLTATANANGKSVSGTATLTVEYDWSTSENIAAGKPATGRLLNPDNTEYGYLPMNATDGNTDTYYTYDGEWGGGDSWVIVDLGQEYLLDAVGVSYGDNSGGRYLYSFGVEGAAMPAESDFLWAVDTVLEGWTSTSALDRKSNSVNTYLPENLVKARYVAVRDADNPNGKPQVKEIYVAGEVYATPVATSISLSSDINYVVTGETVTFTCEVKDQYGVAIQADCTIEIDGQELPAGNTYTPTATGTKEVIARSGDLETSMTLYVVAEENDKDNVTKPSVSSTNENVTVQGNEIHWSEMDASAVLTFDKGYDFTLIKLTWETACASDYTVTATDVNGNVSTILVVTDRPYSGHNEVDRICQLPATGENLHRASSTASLTAIKSLTITPTAFKHNPGWTTKLLNVEAYGDETVTPSAVDDVFAAEENAPVDVYNMSGMLLRSNVDAANALEGLPAGIYIVGGKKIAKN